MDEDLLFDDEPHWEVSVGDGDKGRKEDVSDRGEYE